jgi:RNA polymerase sigma-70 factor (ECF subfamily)
MPVPPGGQPLEGADTGFDALRRAVLAVLETPALSGVGWEQRFDVLVAEAHGTGQGTGGGTPTARAATTVTAGGVAGQEPQRFDPPDPHRDRMVGLVQLAQSGDAEAFGQLYDHYVEGIYRFCYYRVSSAPLAEDLTSETFFRALRGIGAFRWQGRDFGAWLTTIARNLVTDHYKSNRNRVETLAGELPEHRVIGPGPEEEALTRLTNEALWRALQQLPPEQRDCLVMRFLQGLSIAETAAVLGRSAGAVKQLQLRAVRNVAKWLPRDMR